MVDSNQGVGSIWNKGNWHWEDRNYTEFAKEYLTKQFATITETTEDANISIYEVKTLNGTASVTIRKQKQIFNYEFDCELYFKAIHLTDDRTDLMGLMKVHEFNQEDDEVNVEITCEKPGDWADRVRKVLRSKFPEKILKEAQSVITAMKNKDIDEQRLAEAKAKSKQAEADYKKVHEQTNEQKMAIAAA